MAFTNTFTYGVQQNNAPLQQFSSSVSTDGITSIDVTLPTTSGFQVLCSIPSGSLRSVAMWTTGVATVVAANLSGTTVASWSMNSGFPLLWQSGFPTTSPVSGLVSQLLTTASVSGTGLIGYFGLDV